MPPKAIPPKVSISQFNALTETVAELESLLAATVLEKKQAEEAKQQAEEGKQAAIEEAVRRTLEETKRQDASQLTTSPSHFKFSDINTLRTTKFNDHNWLSWAQAEEATQKALEMAKRVLEEGKREASGFDPSSSQHSSSVAHVAAS